MKFRTAMLAATVLGVPAIAQAQAIQGLYVSAGVGANFMQDERLRSILVGPQATTGTGVNLGKTRIQLDTGLVGLGSVGYAFGNGIRVELEGDYRENGWHSVGQFTSGGLFNGSFVGLPGTHVHGSEEKYGVMVNVLYDLNLSQFGIGGPDFPFQPYIGAGIGWQHLHESDVNVSGPGFFLRSTGDADALAYQAIIGAAYEVKAVPGLALTLEYRFMGLAGNQSPKAQLFTAAGVTPAKLRTSDNYNHAVLFGIRYAFNQAPPPPPPAAPAPVAAPAPAPARTYLVFFDWDRADLTTRARQIIAEAAQASTRVQYTRILVNGYTDTSGTPAYNMKLSLRRADNVAAELVRDGVPQNAIAIQGYGETHLLVPTGPGVREPQNRRVEIVLQ